MIVYSVELSTNEEVKGKNIIHGNIIRTFVRGYLCISNYNIFDVGIW